MKNDPFTDSEDIARASEVLIRRAAAELRKHAPASAVLRDIEWWLDPDSQHDGTLERLRRAWRSCARSRKTTARDRRHEAAIRRVLG